MNKMEKRIKLFTKKEIESFNTLFSIKSIENLALKSIKRSLEEKKEKLSAISENK